MTQVDLAAAARVSPTQVWLVEKGRTKRPYRDVVERYAEALGVSVEYLRSGQRNPTEPMSIPDFMTEILGASQESIDRVMEAFTAANQDGTDESLRRARQLLQEEAAAYQAEGEAEEAKRDTEDFEPR